MSGESHSRDYHAVLPSAPGALPPTLSPPPASSLLEPLLPMLKFYDITDAVFRSYCKRCPASLTSSQEGPCEA